MMLPLRLGMHCSISGGFSIFSITKRLSIPLNGRGPQFATRGMNLKHTVNTALQKKQIVLTYFYTYF